MRRRQAALAGGALAVTVYDWLARPWMLDWGATRAERHVSLPGDGLAEDMMTHHTRAVTINAAPGDVWPWLVQIGDRRAGFYSYDWIEQYLFPGTVHRVDGRHSATRIHPELQHVQVGDRIDTGSVGRLRIGSPVTICEPGRALVIGSWAFILRPLPGERTRLLVRERDRGWLRPLAPRRIGTLRAAGGLIDYLAGEPLHFAMVRKMMLGIKERAEREAGRSRRAARAPQDRPSQQNQEGDSDAETATFPHH